MTPEERIIRTIDRITRPEIDQAPAGYDYDYLALLLEQQERGAEDAELAVADWIDQAADEDARLVLTDTSRPIVVEKWEGGDSAWLNFELGQARIGVYLHGGKMGVELGICNIGINDGIDAVMTVAELRQIYADLGALLADDRLLGALAEQEARPC